MIIVRSRLGLADNSGAKQVMCIKVLGNTDVAGVGDVIVVSVKEAIPNGKAKKAGVYKAVVVRTKSRIARSDGSFIQFDDNAAVMLDKQGVPIGSRIFGSIPRELRRRFPEIISLAEEVL